MCGIFGLATIDKSDYRPEFLKSVVKDLFKFSESRGKESAGMAARFNNEIKIYKQPIPASTLIRTEKYKNLLNDFFGEQNNYQSNTAIIGHTRLVTNGAMEDNFNNQPVVKDGLVGIHNGIVANVNDLWQRFPLKKDYDVDTEVILSLIRMFINQGQSLIKAVQKTFSLIEGSASIAVLSDNNNHLLLATNTGSLYIGLTENLFVFASERYILEQLIKKHKLKNCRIAQIKANNGCLLDINKLDLFSFNFDDELDRQYGIEQEQARILDISPQENSTIFVDDSVAINLLNIDRTVLEKTNKAVGSLRRCTKCVLPETMPFIEFDEKGVCNYCRNYQKMEIQGETALKEVVADYRSQTGQPDCLVSFSGGRDSCYGLHYIKNVLGLNPIAYSYDWGMITDLGRRNQARMCGKLGVEHILVSADIKKKREFIRKNVTAWLKKPDLGLVPLFMAGDKQFFYYADKLRKQTRAKLIIFCESPLEKTYFKSGFCGIKPLHHTKRIYALSPLNKIKLAAYYTNRFLANPSYINASLLDTLSAYACYYLINHDFLFLFKYIKWDEKEIMSVLLDDYNWETASDTKTTWRIGDATTPFYNYIYYIMAGFTENDTLRSNQIRENALSREQALELIKQENQPRYESIKWYCDTIKIDFKKALAMIDQASPFKN